MPVNLDKISARKTGEKAEQRLIDEVKKVKSRQGKTRDKSRSDEYSYEEWKNLFQRLYGPDMTDEDWEYLWETAPTEHLERNQGESYFEYDQEFWSKENIYGNVLNQR
jgi:hypothetical protein